jgi:glucosylceramidase
MPDGRDHHTRAASPRTSARPGAATAAGGRSRSRLTAAQRRARQRRQRRRRLALFSLLPIIVAGTVILLVVTVSSARPASQTVTVSQTDPMLGERLAPLPSVVLGNRGADAPDSSAHPDPDAATSAATETIEIDSRQTKQTFWGVGAAVTDSSAYLIEKLPAKVRSRLLNRVYGRSGLGLSFGVVPIGASDFTAFGTPYSYDDVPAGSTDPELMHFSINHDDAWDLPVIEAITKIAPKIKLFATTWTAPAWMKANDALNDLGFKGSLLPQYYGTFADYITDWLKAYEARGVKIAAIAPENEPNSPSAFPSMDLNEPAEISLITNDLEPALKSAKLSTEILGGDVGMPRLDEQQQLAASPAGADLAGMAWHCYSAPPSQMAKAAAEYPKLSQVVTECAPNLSRVPTAEDVLGALANQGNAFSAWNLALDATGGPVETPNSGCGGCTGLVTVNARTGQYALSEDAYVLGQVGHYIVPGAVRLNSTDEPTYFQHGGGFGLNPNGILNVAFRNPSGKLVLVTFNQTPEPKTVRVVDGSQRFTVRLPAGAMTTFSWEPAGA